MSKEFIEDQLNDLESLCAELKEMPAEETLHEAQSTLTQIKIGLSGEEMRSIRSTYAPKLKSLETHLHNAERVLLMGQSSKQHKSVAESNLERLKQSLNLLRESEAVAEDTFTHLQLQRDTLQNAKRNLNDTSTDLSTSTSILRRMESWWK